MAGKRIIISRTDSIGDVMLTLPLCGFLKKKYPGCSILFLGRNYTLPVLECCTHIDEIIDFNTIEGLPVTEQIIAFKNLNADVIIHVFPQKQIARLARLAAIPKRIGTFGRVFHWTTCTDKVNFTRKNASLHEAQLNFKLLKPLGVKAIPNLDEVFYYSGFKNVHALPEGFKVPKGKKIILHPKSKGSAVEWGISNFNKLIKELEETPCNVFISGTVDEGKLIRGKIKPAKNTIDLTGKLSLREFIAFIDQCDVLVAASTGPLHIAAALGKRAIGLYSLRRPIHPGRWAPLGKNSTAVSYDSETIEKNKTALDEEIKKISPQRVKELIFAEFSI